MGYTHFWERREVLPRPQFLLAVQECRQLCKALEIPLGNFDGKGRPVFNSTEICFNGHVDSGRLASIQQVDGLIWPRQDAHGLARVGEPNAVAGGWGGGPAVRARVLGPDGSGFYDKFNVVRVRVPRYVGEQAPGGWWFNYCKTNYRPYDLCVQGCLIVLSHHFGNTHFRVASDGGSSDWDDARAACQHVLGYGIHWGEGKLAPVPQPTTATSALA